AEGGLDLRLVQRGLELAGGHEEVVGLRLHAGLAEEVAEDLEVAGLEEAGVLGDLVEVRIGAPLPDLVTDYGDELLGDDLAVVEGRLRRAVERLAGREARGGGDVVVV